MSIILQPNVTVKVNALIARQTQGAISSKRKVLGLDIDEAPVLKTKLQQDSQVVWQNVINDISEDASLFEIIGYLQNGIKKIIRPSESTKLIASLLHTLEVSVQHVMVGQGLKIDSTEFIPTRVLQEKNWHCANYSNQLDVKLIYNKLCEYEPLFENIGGVSFEDVKCQFVSTLKQTWA